MREKRTIDELEILLKEESEPELVLNQDGLRSAPAKKSVGDGRAGAPEPVQVAEQGVWD